MLLLLMMMTMTMTMTMLNSIVAFRSVSLSVYVGSILFGLTGDVATCASQILQKAPPTFTQCFSALHFIHKPGVAGRWLA